MLRPTALSWSIASWLLPAALSAQQPALDLSGGLRDHAGRAAVSASWSVQLGPLSLGAGPRLTTYQGRPQLLRRRAGTTVGLPDSVRLDPSLAGLNLMVAGELTVVGPVTLGANLDLLGVALGPTRSVAGNDFQPGRGSLFLYGHRDRGSLNSELYLRLRGSGPWAVRGGVSHYVIGYTASLAGRQDRYNRFHTVPFVAITYHP